MVYNNERLTRDLHWHIGTTCCDGVGDDCEHEKQFDIDTANENGDLDKDSPTQVRLNNKLMVLMPYECKEKENN